ncbi:ABC transporter ATP-binding protein [Persicirhabdus sediminis]|uniref:ABC transporter ATP-binding protein n=1 Tax=Persicirhabdus sediminis TaxID=454144 RepID=A0A8J7SKB2_9BACT|nr:ABC transporter ATP-binding protein [Persicirhabdus sediminis]MBK1792720.1 ABC transporter ATP-binding protein [Persicirhabdus sediminis]
MDDIRIESLVKEFGEERALDHVNLHVEAGELFFLLGSSGCGKTTLLRSIAGLETPDHGQIFFGDREMNKVPTHKREAAMVFQSFALWPHMTVGQNIAFGLEERRVPGKEIRERVDDALERVQLAGYGERTIDQLSGGQQQRVALARALVVKPKCLLLDEPLSNLDSRLRMEMRSEIRRIVKENGLTGIYVTHDQEEALSMADRMAIMDQGRILQVGTPEQIYRDPLTAHVASFIGETNLIEGEVESIVRDDRHMSVRVVSSAGFFQGRVTKANWRPSEGTPVLVSIRPEAMYIDDSRDVLNRVNGVIEESTYLGRSVQYHFRGDDGLRLRVTEVNPHWMRQPGDHVAVLARTRDVVVLKH